jgi:hypothetical protein
MPTLMRTPTLLPPLRRAARGALGLLPLWLAACGGAGDLQPYYTGQSPRIKGLSVVSEPGNIGGGPLRIDGSGFGDDPTAITVIIGSQNAQVVGVTEDGIDVIVPRGPLEGGPVDVRVGTIGGQARARGAYTYDMAVGAPDNKDFYRDEVAYIAVTNDGLSCLGGLGFDEGTAAGLPCDDTFVFTGLAGLEGRGEAIDFYYPRLHALYTGYRGGFGGAHDLSWEKWSVQTPPQDLVQVDIEGFYSDQRTEIKNFTLVNLDVERLLEADTPAYRWDGDTLVDLSENERRGVILPDGLPDGRRWCADPAAMADFAFAGAEGEGCTGEPYTPVSVSGTFMTPVDCAAPGAMEYDLAELRFCQPDEYQNTRSYRFEPEWPVGEYFFYGARPGEASWEPEEVLDVTAPAHVLLEVPELGVKPTELVLPPYSRFLGTSGFNYDALFGASDASVYPYFAMVGFDDVCADSDGDGLTTGNDVAATFEWAPSGVELSGGGDIVGARTYVRLNISWAGLGWIGGEGVMMKATITVPDAHNVDPETGNSRIEVPASLLYQLPSARQDIGGSGDSFKWGDPLRTDYGFILMVAERITEYAVKAPLAIGGRGGDATAAGAPAKGDGTLVFAYSTGDIGYLLYGIGPDGYASWVNPTDGGDTCTDCADNDGDGWADATDPDCAALGDNEDGRNDGSTTCNDGEDNDGDGLVDAEDPACKDGRDAEANCADGEDNDADGWIDVADPDCQRAGGTLDPAANELGLGDTTCNDGEDNDGDGLVDAEDESCATARAREGNCADGEDNDGDGWTDALDPECAPEGTGIEAVVDLLSPNCDDGEDNDGDGWVDSEDPDCRTTASEERGFSAAGCNDGVDNDGHGDVDRADLACARAGATGDEEPVRVAGCADGRDNDADGYVDGGDPDCELPPYTSERLLAWPEGSGPEVLACYNGVDDDGDGDVDALDSACVDALGLPSGWTRAEDPSAPDCSDGVDGDDDGWPDASDPDCLTGVDELGFGLSACNDGLDNDGDLAFDADDPECVDAADDDEAG